MHFAIIDNAYPEKGHKDDKGNEDGLLDNLTGVTFKTQEPSFVAGYIAAMTTQTGKVGFVGGMKSDVLETFNWGYQAGVAYANATEGKNVQVVSQYIETFTDAAKGKAAGQKMYSDGCDIVFACAGNAGNGVIEAAQDADKMYIETFTDAAKGKAAGQKMYSDGCDIVFACAGNAGNGVIEAAQDADKMVIGVDKDQYDLAPENMLTSVMKNVDQAVIEVSTMASEGEEIGGKNIELSAKDGAVGIARRSAARTSSSPPRTAPWASPSTMTSWSPACTTPPSSCSRRSRTARSSPPRPRMRTTTTSPRSNV